MANTMNGNAQEEARLPPNRRSKASLVKTHKAHLKGQDDSEDSERPVKKPILLEAYQASARSIRELEIIPLSQLNIETHHRGQGIIVKTVTTPYRGAGAVTIVEDEQGNADKIAIYNHSDSSILSNIPEGCIIAVKEPYYTANGENDYMISVDHPSDVILLRFTDPIIPSVLKSEAEQAMTKAPAEWRSAGDAAFIQRDFPTAIFCYTEALEASSSEDRAFQAGVHAKRAGTNLFLGHYDAAIADALASRTNSLTDWRAYFTAAKAAYGLCDYATSRSHFESALAANRAAPGLQREYERCLARIHEEESGSYDFQAMYASLSPQHVHLDSGSFLRNVVVGSSPQHGNGLFAAHDIAAGDILFVEKATFMPNQYEPERASASLYATMVRQLYANPSLAASVLHLYGGDYERTGAEGTIVDGVPVVDVYLAESIRLKNCFSAPLSTFENTKPNTPNDIMSKGLWRIASYLNHSCVPNTMRSFLGDMFISRAVRDIRAGEELFQQYVPVKADTRARQDLFLTGWGFACRCPLCSAEGDASDPAAHDRRMEVLAQVEKIATKRPPNAIVPDAVIRTMDRLAKQLEDLHEPEVYARLPRLTLIYPLMWLVRAHKRRKNHAKVITYAMKVVRNFGFFVPEQSGDVRAIFVQKDAVSLMTVHVVCVLKFAGDAHRALGAPELGDQFEEAAKFGYKILTGFENDLAGLED